MLRKLFVVSVISICMIIFPFYTPSTLSQLILEKNFLESSIGEPGNITVEEFVAVLKNVRLTNGLHPIVLGWSKNDNNYVLKVDSIKTMVFRFVHLLNYGGTVSSLYVTIDGQPVDAKLAVMTILSSPRDETAFDKKRTQQRLVAIEREREEKRVQDEKQRREQLENEQKSFRKENERIAKVVRDSIGTYTWVNAGKYWDGDSSHDDDIITKTVVIQPRSNNNVEITFESNFNKNKICHFNDPQATIEINPYDNKYEIFANDNGCELRICGDEGEAQLNYRGNCIEKCMTSMVKNDFSDKVYPNGYYENLKTKEAALEKQRKEAEGAWK